VLTCPGIQVKPPKINFFSTARLTGSASPWLLTRRKTFLQITILRVAGGPEPDRGRGVNLARKSIENVAFKCGGFLSS
jgi:hypothetical protein